MKVSVETILSEFDAHFTAKEMPARNDILFWLDSNWDLHPYKRNRVIFELDHHMLQRYQGELFNAI